MKCEIIKDLLPSYIDKLTSPASNDAIEKHLEKCDECQKYLKEMSGEIEIELPAAEAGEIDYLRRIKRKSIRTALITAGTLVAAFLVLTCFFAIGCPVDSKDMAIDYQTKDGQLNIDFQLKNGHDLVHSGDSRIIYDDDRNVVGIEYRYKFGWVLNNPFDDVGSAFSLGIELPNPASQKEYTSTVLLEFSDKTVKFVNGELVE